MVYSRDRKDKNFLSGISDTVYTDGVDTVFAVFCILLENGYPVLQIEVKHLLKHHNSKESQDTDHRLQESFLKLIFT